VKYNFPAGGVSWSQPWHAMHRRLLQSSVRPSSVPAAGVRSESWLARARIRTAPRERNMASLEVL
jgi:hypothetical protein